jgi:uncharacterized iron-regulated membrane protein
MATASPRRWPGYATIWRWHFYAGLFCIPFVLWLSLTGSIYLFRPQIEAALDAPYRNVTFVGASASPSRIAAAAVAAVPGSVLHRYQLPDSSRDAVQVIVGVGATEHRVYVHPQSLAILKAEEEEMRPMRILFRLHGELLMGNAGSYIVELAASWAIVMLLTGLVLWWPRSGGVAGVVYPRLHLGGRRFWRDMHAVTGLWISLGALALLLSGLPWAKSWGSYLRVVRTAVEGRVGPQDWSAGSTADAHARAAADAGTRAMLTEHAEHGGMPMAHPAGSLAPLDDIVPAMAALALPGPVLVSPPTGMGEPWTAKSDAANRPLRTTLTLSPDGSVLARKDFAQRRLIDRVVGYGVAAHEGQLFGLANQLLNLIIAAGLALVAASGVVLWWRRRPDGVLGAPPVRVTPPLAIGFVALLVALGVFLPLLGATMVAVLVAERLVLRRLPGAARWLGLRGTPRITA